MKSSLARMVVGLDLPAREERDEVPPIPDSILTADGQVVDTSGRVWKVRQRKDGGNLFELRPFDVAGSVPIRDRARNQFALFVCQLLQYRKADTLKNLCQTAGRFFRWWEEGHGAEISQFSWAHVDEIEWRAFLAHGLTTPDQGNPFARLRQFFHWGAFVMEFSDFDKRLALTLKTIRAPGNRKGAAVRNWDPVKGPLDDDEIHLIVNALQKGAGTLLQRVVVSLLLELGVRPLVLALLKRKHLHRITVPHGNSQEAVSEKVYYHLEVPKLKGREAKITTWKIRPISEQAGALLDILLEQASPREDGDEAPLLPDVAESDQPRGKIGNDLKSWAKEADLISPRTGERLNLAPRRFRYTLATRMAFAGASREQIAEILDHTDLQNVEVYIEAAARGLEEIDEALENSGFDYIVKRSEGRIVRREDPSSPPDPDARVIPGSLPQIPTAPFPLGAIGMCGRDVRKDGLCALAPPLSCYLCDSFVAFDSAPHAEIADAIESTILYAYNTGATPDTIVPRQILATLHAIRQLQAQIVAQGATE